MRNPRSHLRNGHRTGLVAKQAPAAVKLNTGMASTFGNQARATCKLDLNDTETGHEKYCSVIEL